MGATATDGRFPEASKRASEEATTDEGPGLTIGQATAFGAAFGMGLVSDEGAAEFFGVSKRTFGTFMGADWMPKPIVLGPRLRRWALDELRAAVAAMPRQTERAQPASLLRAQVERMKAAKVPR